MNKATSPEERARLFFDDFVVAFATFEPERIADLFATPGVTLRADGSIVALTTRLDVIHYYQTALEGYYRRGCRGCAWTQLDVTPIGTRSILATVTWDLFNEGRETMTRWRQSYSLVDTDDGPRAYASASHSD